MEVTVSMGSAFSSPCLFEKKVEEGCSYLRKRVVIRGILMTSGRRFKGVISVMIPRRVTIPDFYGCKSNW